MMDYSRSTGQIGSQWCGWLRGVMTMVVIQVCMCVCICICMYVCEELVFHQSNWFTVVWLFEVCEDDGGDSGMHVYVYVCICMYMYVCL